MGIPQGFGEACGAVRKFLRLGLYDKRSEAVSKWKTAIAGMVQLPALRSAAIEHAVRCAVTAH